MKLAETLSPYREAFLRLFYPSLCAVCRKLLELEEKSLCPGCLGGFEKYKLEPSEERIRQTLGYGDEAWALFRYEGPVKEILHQVKFERHRDLLLLFEPALVDFFLRRSGIAVYDEIWSIPLDFRRRLEREFNQSELVARKVRGILRKEGKENALRKRLTLPQSLLGREARRWNLDGAFHLRNAKEASGKSILLVDDIFTTGATLEVAAKILKRAGAFRVGYLVLARTLARSEEPQVPRMSAVPGQPGPGARSEEPQVPRMSAVPGQPGPGTRSEEPQVPRMFAVPGQPGPGARSENRQDFRILRVPEQPASGARSEEPQVPRMSAVPGQPGPGTLVPPH